jgi:hypothetical protein
MVGPDEWKAQFWAPFRTAFADIRVNVDAAASNGSEVAVRWSASMRHVGPVFGLPPTGKRVSFRGSTWMRVENGQLVEGWDTWDFTGLLVQLGAGIEMLRGMVEQKAAARDAAPARAVDAGAAGRE